MSKKEIINVALRSARNLIDVHSPGMTENAAKNRIRMIIIDLEHVIGD